MRELKKPIWDWAEAALRHSGLAKEEKGRTPLVCRVLIRQHIIAGHVSAKTSQECSSSTDLCQWDMRDRCGH